MKWTVLASLSFEEHETRRQSTKDFGVARLGPAIEKFLFAIDLKIIGADYLNLSALDIASVKS